MPATQAKFSPKEGKVTASVLNVRADPSTRNAPLGQLERGAAVHILDRSGNWYKIKFGDGVGYVSGDYVVIDAPSSVGGFLFEHGDLRTVLLEPPAADLIELRPNFSSRQKTVARAWNLQGGLLAALCNLTEIVEGAAVSVLCVESGGKGFGSDNRMIIRFENHIFWGQWGKNHPEEFNAHFRYSSQKPWQNHAFRLNLHDPWIPFHGKQNLEWLVFDFARRLDEPAAMRSISMGGPQIMGFNHSRIGYDSARSMFDAFQSDIRYQILGLFDFIKGPGVTSPIVEALQRNNFESFASFYNGPGQAARYGHLIGSYFTDFNNLRVPGGVV